jgi:hypothetical protein
MCKKIVLSFFIFESLANFACSQSIMNHKGNFTLIDSVGYLGFEFYENKLFAISDAGKPGKQNYLQVFDVDGNMLKSCKVPFNFTVLRKSQHDELFIGSTDTLYNVFYRNDTLKFLNSTTTRQFNEANTSCFFQANGICFVEVKEVYKSIFELHAVYENLAGKVIDRIVHTIVDTSMDAILANKETAPKHITRTIPTNEVQIIKNKKVRGEYKMGTKRDPVRKTYASAYIESLLTAMNSIGNRIYFFDYTNGKILKFSDKLEYLETVIMQDRSQLENLKFHMVDAATGNFYCILKKDNQFMLAGYDQETGRLLNFSPLPEFSRVNNARVNNARFYFLHKKNPSDSNETIYYVDLK